MTITATRTEAETEFAHQFAKAAPLLPGAGWVPEVRAAAMRAFERTGLPHRRIEEWKYTDLRNRVKAAYPPAQCSSRKVDAALLADVLGAELAAVPAIRLVLLNGRYVARLLPSNTEMPESCHLGPLSGAIGQAGYEWMQPGFALPGDGAGEPVLALNAAFVSDGIVMRIEDNAHLALPVHIVSIIDADAPKAVATRNFVRIGKGAAATIIESHVAIGDAPSQTTAVTQLHVEAGGSVHHVKHVEGDSGALHLGHWQLQIGEGATYRGFQLTAGAGLLRNESRVAFDGPDARLDLSGLMLGRGSDHIDTTMVIDHTYPGCEGRELFKIVLDDQARAVFQGKVVVAAEAQKTDGKQMAQALMLSEDAEFDSKPELEIYADDVVCGHGSTSAEIDADMLFYLRSRGIPEAHARSLLIESFASEALDKVENEALRVALSSIALRWLGHENR
ncbi:MAG: Fe-S cluster assembly protein SufD [Hyphomicrobiaceae bacterium]